MRKVTCYAWGVPGDWEALCVDFDLAAQGKSLEEVRRELGDAIECYLESVMDGPAEERRRFLNRKAPLTLRLRLALLHRAFTLTASLRARGGKPGFTRSAFALVAPLPA